MSRSATMEDAESLLPTPDGYARRATLPLHSLVMLLPLMIVYETGTAYFTSAAQHGQDQHIIAFSRLLQFFRWVGATGRHMPALALGSILLAWHVARRDSWKVELKTILGMFAESLLLGLPLLLLAFIINRYFPLIGLRGVMPPSMPPGVRDRLIMDVGAGVYEEFVFRLALFTLLSLMFTDILKLKDELSHVLIVVIAGVLFALYHYWSPTEHFVFRIFAFRTVAGIYFGAIFMCRGFGITAGSHCAYDIIITLW